MHLPEWNDVTVFGMLTTVRQENVNAVGIIDGALVGVNDDEIVGDIVGTIVGNLVGNFVGI